MIVLETKLLNLEDFYYLFFSQIYPSSAILIKIDKNHS